MRRKNDVSTLRYARSFERLQLRTSVFNKKVYKWALRVSDNNCRNWCFRVRKMFKESQMEHLFSGVDFSVVNKGYVVASIQDSIHHKFLSKWSTDVNRDISQTRTGRNKLRTYKQRYFSDKNGS